MTMSPIHFVLVVAALVFITPTACVECGGRTCGYRAVCVNDECQCPTSYPEGIPQLVCFFSEFTVCGMISDPHLVTNTDEKTRVPIPCRMRLSLFQAGACQVTVYAIATQVIDAFIYVTELEVEVKVEKDTAVFTLRTEPKEIQCSINGGTTSTITTQGSQAVNDIKIDVIVGDKVLEVYSRDKCYFNTFLEIFVGGGKRREQARFPTPGAIIYSLHSITKFPSSNSRFPYSICGTYKQDNAIQEYSLANKLLSSKLGIILAWLNSRVQQKPGSSCGVAMATYSNACDSPAKITSAINGCGPSLYDSNRECVSKVQDDLMSFFGSCIRAVCNYDRTGCDRLYTMAVAKGCKLPQLLAACKAIL